MNLKLVASVCSLSLGLAVPAFALQFTNLDSHVTVPLYGVTAGGSNVTIFAAVGSNSVVASAKYAGSLLPWVSSSVPTPLLLLKCATQNTNTGEMLAGGPSALVFSSMNGTQWTARANAFAGSASVNGLAYNNGRFVAAAGGPSIAWADAPLSVWNVSLLSALNPLESYRGITAFGANGFAVCGVKGTVRISTDRGANFNSSRAYVLAEQDLLGIAWGGGQRLVCVGKLERILLSNDGGASWAAVRSGTASLNAVGYTGSEFIAVGDGGLVLTSPDGSTWTPQPSGTAQNLYGVTCATSGQLQGVTAIVGAAGTVVVAGTPPPQPVSSGDRTICGNATNTLSVAKTNDVNHPLVTTVVDWYNNQSATWVLPGGNNSGGSSSIDGSVFTPPATDRAPSGAVPKLNTYSVRTRDLRTGYSSANQTVGLTVYPIATVNAVAAQGPYCNTNAGLGINFSGPVAGTTYSWSSTANVGFGTSGAGSIPAFTTTNGGSAPVTAVVTVTPTANGCVGTPSTFTVTVNPRPTAPISLGDVTNCVGIANPPLSVSVPSGVSVEWHDSLAGGNFLGNGSSYTPTNTAVGVDTFYAQAIGLGGCASGSRTAVSLTIEGCSGLLSISLIDTNVVLVWYGNLQLCAADCSSGIPPLASWSILKTGAPGVTNRWTNSIQGSSFRLFQLRPQ